MQVCEVSKILEEFAPLSLQEEYDNAGLLTGNPEWEVKGALCTLDVTEKVLDEAIRLKANLIIAHHPFIFGNIKSITGKNTIEKILIKAVKNDLAIYSAHTNFDNVPQGVNQIICEKIGLENLQILDPKKNALSKIVCFVPAAQAESVRNALMENGAGQIGNYDYCSYNLEGKGSFRAGQNTQAFVGEKGEIHFENETRIETIVPNYAINQAVKAMIKAHPYEEVAFDVYPLSNLKSNIGSGMIGDFAQPVPREKFLKLLQQSFDIPAIKYSGKLNSPIRKVAVCGGSGSFLLAKAIAQNADAFVTADIKYHQFFDAEDRLLLCDIGHYESEQFTKEIFYSLLTKKISTFAVHLTSIVTNPIKYYV